MRSAVKPFDQGCALPRRAWPSIGLVRLAHRGVARAFQLIQMRHALTRRRKFIAAAVVRASGKRWRLLHAAGRRTPRSAGASPRWRRFSASRRGSTTPSANLRPGLRRSRSPGRGVRLYARSPSYPARRADLRACRPRTSTASHGKTLIAAAKAAGRQGHRPGRKYDGADLVAAYGRDRIIRWHVRGEPPDSPTCRRARLLCRSAPDRDRDRQAEHH